MSDNLEHRNDDQGGIHPGDATEEKICQPSPWSVLGEAGWHAKFEYAMAAALTGEASP